MVNSAKIGFKFLCKGLQNLFFFFLPQKVQLLLPILIEHYKMISAEVEPKVFIILGN
jgi:hypothetical protein